MSRRTPLGFALGALSAFGSIAPGAGIHAWTAGATGVTTLVVMSRASLGRTGQELKASPALQGIYVVAGVTAIARMAAALVPGASVMLLSIVASAWASAFLGFAALHAPLLCPPKRQKPRAGGQFIN